jgi:hypothetical protein
LVLDSGGFALGRRTAVGVLACALLLAGCAEKHEASTTLPSASGNASASASEGITAKVLPPVGPADFPVPIEARQHTPAGVQAFTRYYVALVNRQAEKLDPQPLRELSRKCQTCEELAQSLEHTKNAGHHYRGGDLSVSGMGSALITDVEGETSFVLEETPTSVVDATGAVVEVRSTKHTRYTGGVMLRWDTARSTWLMAQLDADPI